MMHRSPFILLLLLLTLSACEFTADPVLTFFAGEHQNEPGTPVLFSWNGANANTAVADTVVARTEEEWQALWQRVQQPAPGKLPSSRMAVAVLLGQRPTGGYGVEIASAERNARVGEPDKLVVLWREYKPDESAVVTQDITSPWAIRLVDTWPYAPSFQHESETSQTNAAWQRAH